MYARIVDERQFFTEKPEQRPANFQCPRCRRTSSFTIRWLRRTRKAQIPPGADARDRVIFEKSKDHLIRVDDDVTCKVCGKRFEIPSRLHGTDLPSPGCSGGWEATGSAT